MKVPVKFSCSDEVLTALEGTLSPERMATYLRAASGDRESALRIYTWNTALSAAFYGPLQGLEVALRNAMHRELCAKYGPVWYQEPGLALNPGHLHRISRAKKLLERGRYPTDSPHVVAALSFGFWVSLLGPGGRGFDYEKTLWRPALYKAFPHRRLSRRDAHKRLDYLRTLRNRIAHHEPIFKRDLHKDYQSILEVSGWICPHTRAWIEHHSRVNEVLTHGSARESLRF